MRPSGVFWVTRFPASASLDDLEPGSQDCVRKFLGAISSARAGLPNVVARMSMPDPHRTVRPDGACGVP